VVKMMKNNIEIIAADRNARKNYQSLGQALQELREILGLENIPEKIECFDISNLQGKNAVASMVFFRNGIPEKSQYRRYRIRGYDTPDDPGMIHEVVARRVQHLANENLPYPDLMVIDGGIPQLSRAFEAAQNFTRDIRIVSLAKRNEEIYYDLKKKPLVLKKDSSALHLIQRVRDEAHRFALLYHRKLRGKEISASILDHIPGIGEKTKKDILKNVKSVELLKKMNSAEIAEISGIGKKTAEKIFEFFHDNV